MNIGCAWRPETLCYFKHHAGLSQKEFLLPKFTSLAFPSFFFLLLPFLPPSSNHFSSSTAPLQPKGRNYPELSMYHSSCFCIFTNWSETQSITWYLACLEMLEKYVMLHPFFCNLPSILVNIMFVTWICLGWCLISLWLTINQFIYSFACSKHPLPREALCVLVIHLKLSFSFFFLLCLL